MSGGTGPDSPNGGQRLLLVDDDVDLCTMVGLIAEEVGFRVRALHHGAGFAVALDEFRPHRILLDLAMPDYDGLELMRVLAERGCRAVVTVVSSHPPVVLRQAERLAAAYGLRFGGVLRKPFAPDALRAALGSA